MNKKGQSLVFFILFLPIIFLIIGILFDTSKILNEKLKLKHIAEDGIYYLVKEGKSTSEVKNIINQNNINIERINIDNDSIFIKTKIPSYFGKIINKSYYEIEISLYGYIKDEKLIIEEKG